MDIHYNRDYNIIYISAQQRQRKSVQPHMVLCFYNILRRLLLKGRYTPVCFFSLVVYSKKKHKLHSKVVLVIFP